MHTNVIFSAYGNCRLWACCSKNTHTHRTRCQIISHSTVFTQSLQAPHSYEYVKQHLCAHWFLWLQQKTYEIRGKSLHTHSSYYLFFIFFSSFFHTAVCRVLPVINCCALNRTYTHRCGLNIANNGQNSQHQLTSNHNNNKHKQRKLRSPPQQLKDWNGFRCRRIVYGNVIRWTG